MSERSGASSHPPGSVCRAQLAQGPEQPRRRLLNSPGLVESYDATGDWSSDICRGMRIPYMPTPKLRGRRSGLQAYDGRYGLDGWAHTHTVDSIFGKYLPPLPLSRFPDFTLPLHSSYYTDRVRT